MPYRPDRPTGNDLLGFKRLVDGIVATAFPGKTPLSHGLTIGVHARWGGGKSTLLELLKQRIVSDAELAKRTAIVEFAPWVHQEEKHLLVPLLLYLQGVLPKSAKARKLAWKIARVTARFLLFKSADLVALATGAGPLADAVKTLLDPKTIEEMGEAEEKKDAPALALSDLAQLKDQVAEVVAEVRGNRTLVFLIDDLDRCHPPHRVVALLEQIKAFLDLPGCLFVIACDRHLIEKHIEDKFPTHGRHYLEKIIQLPLHLPAPNARQLALLAAHDQTSTAERIRWENLAPLLGYNPRRYVRLNNEFVLASEVLGRDTTSARPWTDALLLRWLVLREISPAFAEQPELVLQAEDFTRKQGPVQPEKLAAFLGATKLSQSQWDSLAFCLRNEPDEGFLTWEGVARYSTLTSAAAALDRVVVQDMIRRGGSLPQEIRKLDLSDGWLAGADFTNRTFEDVQFDRAKLQNANFEGATFARCSFEEAEIQGVRLKNARWLDILSPAALPPAFFDELQKQNPLPPIPTP